VKPTLTLLAVLLLGPLCALHAAEPRSAESVILPAAVNHLTETWRAVEITFESAKTYADPLNDAEVNAVFTSPSGRAYTVPGFWDGGRTWRVRFAPPECGVWKFVTVCTDSSDGGLHGKTGTLGANRYQGKLDIYRRGFIRTAPEVRYFMYADGTPFFYLGDTHWSMPMEPFETMFACVVDRRVAQGFTVYQSQPLGAKYRFADGLAEADLPGLRDLDRRFKYIADAGLVHANAQLFSPPEISKPCYTDAYLKKLCRMWVARFGAHPVLWTTGQEVDNDFYFDRGDQNHFDAKSNPWKKVLAWVHEYDPYRHPGTAHMEFLGGAPEPETFPPKNERPKYGYGVQASTSSFRDVPGHSWYGVQWTPPHESEIHWRPIKDFWENGQGKPVVNYEGSYDHLWTLGDGARQQGWIAYLNGMFGHGYGAIDIWFYKSNYDMDKDTVRGSVIVTVEHKKTAWTTSLEFPSARELGLHMKAFFASLEWWKLTPRFNDPKWFMPANTAWHSLATIDTDVFVLYLYNRTTTATGTLCNLRDTAYTAQWFDPRTGAYLDLGTFTPQKDASGEGCRWRIPAKPSAADWVLLVKASPGGWPPNNRQLQELPQPLPR
jgi:hypothetical protein